MFEGSLSGPIVITDSIKSDYNAETASVVIYFENRDYDEKMISLEENLILFPNEIKKIIKETKMYPSFE